MAQNECMIPLLMAGADVNARDNSRHTPLFYAAFRSKAHSFFAVLLKFNAQINLYDTCNNNTIEHYIVGIYNRRFSTQLDEKNIRKSILLMFAAGEFIQKSVVKFVKIITKRHSVNVLAHLTCSKTELCLMHLCRERIRMHLLNLDPHRHLFNRIPQLGLPSLLTDYLLYNAVLPSTDHSDNEEAED